MSVRDAEPDVHIAPLTPAQRRGAAKKLFDWYSADARVAQLYGVVDRAALAPVRPVFRGIVGDDDVVAPRPTCARCGRRWLRRPHGGWNFVRRCAACRLVSH